MSFSPKPLFPLLLLLFTVFNLHAQNAWINEFHYDNDGGDVGEFVEVVVEDAGSYDLSLFTLHLYNGNNGESYGSHTLDSFTEGNTENGFTIFYKDISGIQNGAPDGFSLDYEGTLLQFISYEGAFTGVGGSADGQISEDVVVEETTSTPIGESIQLSGSGASYSNFSWAEPATETKGQLNNGQIFGAACTSPTTQASFSIPSIAEIEGNQISLNWSRGDGDRVVVLLKESSAVSENPQNGTIYTADADFSSGLADEIGTANFVVYDGTGTSAVITGLTEGTEYYFSIFEYLSTDQCYLTESETISVTTTTSFDEDSEINAPSSQIPSSDISSIANSEADAIEVFKFEISDSGSSDGAPTFLNTIVIEKSTENEVSDWSETIKGAKLNDGSTDLTISNLYINQDNIEFDLNGSEFSIADGSTETLTISIWLNETQTDGDTLGFKISENHSFAADVSGSLLSNSIAESITSNPFSIQVEATDFEISTVLIALVNEPFNLSARAVDVNGNTDLAIRDISLTLNTGSGNLISSSVGLGPLPMHNGFYEWTDLEYDTEESILIEVSDGNGLSVNSPEIDIIPLITTVFISEYIEGSSSNKALEIFNNSGKLIDLADFSLAIFSNGSESVSFEYQLSEIQDSLADQGNLVIANTSADSILQVLADTTQFSITNFNGDDALALLYKGNIIDVIGDIGNDPGSGWQVAGISEATQDKTLVRKASIINGNPNSLASFGSDQMDSEWIVYDTDEFSYLGNHFRCTAPAEQVSDVSIQNITESTAEVNWTAPSDLNSILLMKEGTAVDFPPISGTTYTANSDFTLADEIGNGNKIVFAVSGENVIITNLNSGTSYHIAIYAYDDIENCYNLDATSIADFTTNIALDEDSEINDLTQPVVSSLLSTIDEESEAVDVFSFQIADLATKDTVSTLIDKMVFESASNNSLTWGNTLNAVLKDENGIINNAEINIVDESIEISFPENEEYEIPSGESVDFSLAIWFNRFEVSDTPQFALQIPREHEFISSDSGSLLASTLIESISSNQIEIIEVFDRIEDIRNGINGTTYVTTGYVSSNDFGSGNTEFYIQKDESTTYEQGIAVYSDVEIPGISTGNKVKVLGSREEFNGSVRVNADTIIILNNDQFMPETYSISAADFSTTDDLIGTRVQLDSMILIQPELWGNFDEDVFQFTNANDSVFVKIEPNNTYFNGNAQVPFGAVDIQGVMESRNGSIQLIISLDEEISDPYSPIFVTEPQISSIQGETVDLSFSVNELSTVYYAVKKAGDSMPDLQTLKNPLSDAQIISSGSEKIEIEDAGSSISLSIQNLTSNSEYSVFIVAEDTLGNTNAIKQLDFLTLNADADHDVRIVQAQDQISATEINAFDASHNFVPVFNFALVDGGTSDSISTFVNQMVIHSSAENEVDFSEILSEVELYDLSNEVVINTQISIFPDSIVFELDEIFELSDGDSNSFQLRIKLNERVEDEQILAFEIPANQSGWQLLTYGSQLVDDIGESVTSSVHSVEVEATDFKLVYPEKVYIEEEFNIEISAEDGNGNIDEDERALSISVDSEVELTGSTEADLVNGQGVFDSLSFNLTGLFSFEISDGSIFKAIEINFIQPELTLDTTRFNSDFGLVNYPEQSGIQSYQLTSKNLKDSILVVAPEAFQLSLNPDFIDETDTLIFEKDSFIATEIFLRFLPPESNGEFYNGNIQHFSRGADTLGLSVSGQEGTLTLSTVASARDKAVGERVKIQGVVIGGDNQFESKRVVQDKTAGIVINGLTPMSLNFGDSVEIEGVLAKEDDWLMLIPEKEITLLSPDSIIVDPILKTITEINESVEWQRVKIENLHVSANDQFTEGKYFIVDDNSDSLILKLNRSNHPLVGTDIPIGKVNVTGFIGRRNARYQIYPDFAQDLEIIPRDTILILKAPADGLNFGQVMVDQFSESKAYSLHAENLPEDLLITSSDNFEISLLKNTNYAKELELPINEIGDIPEIEIYVRFSPISARGGEMSGKITHVSGGQQKIIPLYGIEELVTSNHSPLGSRILIYPNPVGSKLNIEMMISGDFQYLMIGSDGKIILVGELCNSKILKLDGLEKGIYLLIISNSNNEYHQRIIKK